MEKQQMQYATLGTLSLGNNNENQYNAYLASCMSLKAAQIGTNCKSVLFHEIAKV
jgi:hypothetical protein